MEHVLKADDIKYALKNHGNEEAEALRRPPQRAITVEDLKRIPAVLDDYDNITVQPRVSNRTSIVYDKPFPDGKMVYVERVIETSKKGKPRLVTKTAWVVASSGVKSTPAPVSTPGRKEDISAPDSEGKLPPDEPRFMRAQGSTPPANPAEGRQTNSRAIPLEEKVSERVKTGRRSFGAP